MSFSCELCFVNYEDKSSKLTSYLIGWQDELVTLKKSLGPAYLYMDQFNGTSDPEVLLDSLAVVNWIREDCDSKKDKQFLVVESIKDNSLQGVGVFTDNFDQLDYLQTAPSNLRIESNKGNPRCIRGVGSLIMQKAMELGVANGCKSMEASCTESSRGFYTKLGFKPKQLTEIVLHYGNSSSS